MTSIEQAKALIPDIAKLSDDQFSWIQQLVRSMVLPLNSTRNPTSDVLIDDRSMGLFSLYLVTHHVLSAEPFKKKSLNMRSRRYWVFSAGKHREHPLEPTAATT